MAVGNLLDKNFPEYTIRENYYPDWLVSSNLTRLELDFYIEELKIAFEVQGDQHFKFTPYFHKTIDDFERRKLYDQEKKDLCYGNSVRLIEVCVIYDAILAIKDIRSTIDIKSRLAEYEQPLGAILRGTRQKSNEEQEREQKRLRRERENAIHMIRRCGNYPTSHPLQDRHRILRLLCSKFVSAALFDRQYDTTWSDWSPDHISPEEFEKYIKELKTSPTVLDAINTLEKYLAVGA